MQISVQEWEMGNYRHTFVVLTVKCIQPAHYALCHLLQNHLRAGSTVTRRLTTGIRSVKCVNRRFRRCAKVTECTYTNLDSIAYYTPRLYDIAYCSYATNLYSMLLY